MDIANVVQHAFSSKRECTTNLFIRIGWRVLSKQELFEQTRHVFMDFKKAKKNLPIQMSVSGGPEHLGNYEPRDKGPSIQRVCLFRTKECGT